MGLAASDMPTAANNYKIVYYPPQPRAVIQLVDFDDNSKLVDYGREGRVHAHDADQGNVRAALPGTGRSHPREAERQLSLGRRQRRQALPRVCGDDGGGGILMTVRDILRVLRHDRWFIVRQTGNHRQLHHATKAGTVTVAGKPSKPLHPKIVTSIFRQAQIEEP